MINKIPAILGGEKLRKIPLKPRTTIGAEEVVGWGGDVKHIDLVPGKSTSKIIDVIKKNI